MADPLNFPPSDRFDPAPRRRFDWWQALVRVLSSIEAVRDGRAMYVLLAAFSGAGLALATAQASFGRGEMNWAIGQGAAALFIAFYGSTAAGLLSMDRALGRPSRDVVQAIEDALGIGHRVLVALLAMGVLGAGIVAGLLGLYWLSGLPKVGPWIFVLVVPVTVLVIGLALMAAAVVVAPLTGPTVWAGASSTESVRLLLRLIRERLLQAAVLMGGLSLATGLVGAACSVFVMVGGRVMAEASIFMLGVDVNPQLLMAGLFGYGLHSINATGIPKEALPYISSATVGGGVVFALALVMPTLVYLRGVCEVYLALMAADKTE
ncbi:MAG TPA: hypothetical protein VFW93_18335 [Aquabacterium sp.]|uniref:hypothetical protein n=1 Tax=Aquabacterium sp. TaxID=1872578 RepID=UPI002E30E4FC|nr:hypothetical protein [Aquabacterium sp.]HEX5358167.1 hypothetical protein [Aquabacterium sp.]